MTDQEPTTVDDFKSKMSQLDAQGQKEMDAAIDAALQRALANQQRRKPTAQYQTQLRAEYEKALSTAGSKTARVELRAMFRTRGLDI